MLKPAVYKIVNLVLRAALRRLPHSQTSEAIALWWGYRFNPAFGRITLRSGAQLHTNAIDHSQLLLYYLGTFEPLSLKMMRRYVGPGKTLLDVGANIGLFSVEAIRAGASAISIEAAPKHVAVLRKSGLPHIVHCAVSDSDGEVTMSVPVGGNQGMYTMGAVAGSDTFTVRSRRIDDIVGDRRIDFIKMDIEGAEYKALIGAHATIARCKAPILIELNEGALRACGSTAKQVKELLATHGYHGYYLSGEPIPQDAEHRCDECVFLNGTAPGRHHHGQKVANFPPRDIT